MTTFAPRALPWIAAASGLALAVFACSDPDTEVGPQQPAADAGLPPSSEDGGSDSGPANGGACDEIASACHPFDLGTGKPHDCHELSHGDSDDATCAAERSACLAACSPSAGTLDVQIRFAGVMGSEPFECGKKYTNVGAEGSSAEPIDFRFYVMDVRLLDEAGSDVPVQLTPDGAFQSEDVALIDFEDKTGACDNGTAQTNDVIRGTVPFGKYRGIAFTIGVPESINHTDVATAPSPLNLTGMNWSWAMGRIFLVSGMRADTGSTDGGAPTNDHFVHVGSTGCTGTPEDGGTVSCTKPNRATFRFATFRPSANVVTVDLKELMKDQNLATVMHGCHSFGAANCEKPFGHVGIDFATGQPTATQTVVSAK